MGPPAGHSARMESATTDRAQNQQHAPPDDATASGARFALDTVRGAYADYPASRHPLGTYAALTVVYNAALMVVLARTRAAPAPSLADFALGVLATHKLSRVITKDFVTSFIRAPFVTCESDAPTHGELTEKAKGKGFQRGIGELLTCPYCMDQWVALALIGGRVLAPRPTRLLTYLFATVAIADAAHLAYVAASTAQQRQ